MGTWGWLPAPFSHADLLAGTTSPRSPHSIQQPKAYYPQPVGVAGVGCPMVASRARADARRYAPLAYART